MAGLIHLGPRGLDWETVLQRAVDWHLVIPIQRALARLEELWPGTVPGDARQALRELAPTRSERCVHAWVTGRPRTATSNTLLSLATLPGIAGRITFLLEVAFPSPAYMRQRYCPRRPHLWPLSYGLRGALALKYLMHGRG